MTFSDEDIYEAVKHHLPTVNEYIESHGGAIRLLGSKDGKVYIELTGACHGCSMSLMTTKMVVQKKLRELIHPELFVVNVDGTAENVLPDEYYTQEDENVEDDSVEKKEGFLDKVKKLF
jgi:Fe-S cluster biogenesis protein NfuA